MPEPMLDQAAGLRRLFKRPAGRFVGLVRPQPTSGHAVLTAKLAHALARQAQRVLVLDETESASAVARVLGLCERHDLLDVVRGAAELNTACAEGPGQVRVLPAARLVRELPRLSGGQRRVLREAVAALRRRADLILIHADAGDSRQSLLQVADEVTVLLSPAVGDITSAYAALKRLAAQNPRRDYAAIVLGSSCETHGLAVFNNMREAARRHLGVDLSLRGVLPERSRLDDDVVALRGFADLSGAIDEVAQSMLYGQREAVEVPEPAACLA